MDSEQHKELIQDQKDQDTSYLEKKNIQNIFTSLLSKILISKPKSDLELKEFMIFQLKKMKMNNKLEFFEEEDFELMYDSLNVFKEEEISKNYIYKGLEMIGAKNYDRETIVTKFKLDEVETVNKKIFVKIMKREYSKMVTIDLN